MVTEFKKEVIDTLNLNSLNRLNPIFKEDFSVHYIEKNIFFIGRNLRVEFWKDTGDNFNKKNVISWVILTGNDIAITYNHYPNFAEAMEFLVMQDTPQYIKIFYNLAKQKLKSCTIDIVDDLPHSLVVNFNLDSVKKIQGEKLIRNSLSKILSKKNNNINSDAEKIIRDETIPLKKAIDRSIRTSGIRMKVNHSFCLTCGIIIQQNRKFCNSEENYRAKNRDNCLNTFNYWLKSRLNIETKEERAEKREYYFNELQKLIRIYPNAAFDELKARNEDLFKRKKKNHLKI